VNIVKSLLGGAAVAAGAIVVGTAPVLADTTTTSVLVASGGLSLVTTPAATVFSAVTLTGTAQNATASLPLHVSDLTGSNAGWHVTLAGANLVNGADSLVVTATPAAAACESSGSCVATTTTGAPFAVTATATPLDGAAINTGEGTVKFTTALATTVPPLANTGTYSSTYTLTLVSGP
jgi:hypothetical protein